MEQLADLLWPDKADTQQALGRLYHTLHALRLALEADLARGQDSRHLLIRDLYEQLMQAHGRHPLKTKD